MKNISGVFNQVYEPKKALIVFRSVSQENDIYIEAYDMDENGCPINAHPLSVNETAALADCLNSSADLRNDFLVSRELLPENILYVNSSNMGYALWYTHSQKVKLFFKKELSIPCGEAFVPAMVWKANKDSLQVFALTANRKPDIKTPLYHAPYFNIYENGSVCMGTVDINIEDTCCLEDFISTWQQYFFESYFSHLMSGHSPVKGNIVQLWQSLVDTGKKFPNEVLLKSAKALKNLIV